ncbi:MAG: 50S ribosomal protein L4 [Elusimicrobiota bacterium]
MKLKKATYSKSLKSIKFSPNLIHEVTQGYLANSRQNSAYAKDRSEKSGGGKKPWRQKGTGRARHGSMRSPIWKGGGVTFGPNTERNLKKRIPSQKKQKAVLQVLARKVCEGRVFLTDEIKLQESKTRYAEKLLVDNLKEDAKRKILMILDEKDEKIYRAFRNLPHVVMKTGLNFNTYDLLYGDLVIFTKKSWDNFMAKRGVK